MNNSLFCCTSTAKVLLVLLRIAIGWHLLYEGLYKLSTFDSPHPWSSRGYLERSEGPLRGYFQGLVGEANPQTEFDPEAIFQQWMERVEEYDQFYGLNEDQRETTVGEVNASKKELAKALGDPQRQRIVKQYRDDLAAPPGSLTSSERNRMTSNGWIIRNKVRELTDKLDSQLFGLMIEPGQVTKGRMAMVPARIRAIDRLVVWSLILCGGGLLVGLFSRLTAVAGAVMLMMFYVAMPALPGLSAATAGTSHYLYVNNNIIEALALLALATTNSGRWAGLDAVVGKLISSLQTIIILPRNRPCN